MKSVSHMIQALGLCAEYTKANVGSATGYRLSKPFSELKVAKQTWKHILCFDSIEGIKVLPYLGNLSYLNYPYAVPLTELMYKEYLNERNDVLRSR